MQYKLARLKAWQKLYKEKVLDDKRFRWTSRAVYGLTLLWAGYLFMQSMAYYQAIGQGDSLYKGATTKALCQVSKKHCANASSLVRIG